MNNAHHFTDDRLLAFADGELESAEQAEVLTHVGHCAVCGRRLEELREVSSEYAAFHRGGKWSAVPPPPREWENLRRRMNELERNNSRATVLELPDASRSKSWRAVPAGLAIAASIVIAFVIWRSGSPTVNAAELLDKAEAAERSSRRASANLRVRTGSRVFVRPAVLIRESTRGGEKELPALFASARYDWNEPLAVRSFVRWRGGLRDKRDRVESVQSAGRKAYRVRTSTQAGALSEASLTLNADTLDPVSGSFQFRGGELVEIDAVPGEAVIPRPPATDAQAAEGSAPEPIDEASQELHVIAALHRMGADLGDPVELVREGSKLVVIATALHPNRRDEMKQALAQVPAVEVRFEDPRARYNASRPDRPAGSGTQTRLSLPTLEQRLGSAASVEQFANDAIDLSEAVMQRAFALRQLAVRFPSAREKSLNRADRELLATMRKAHSAAMNTRLAELRKLLEEVTPATPAPGKPQLAADWQTATEQLTGAAQKLDEVITRIFAAGAGESGIDQLGPALHTASAVSDDYERLGRSLP